ncbi:udp-n-acetylglucosamine [Nannochloropsis oceanica]
MEQTPPGHGRPRGPRSSLMMSLSLLLLQAVVPLVHRSSHKSSPRLLPSSLNGEGFIGVIDEANYHPASVALLAEALKCLGAWACYFVMIQRRPGATMVQVVRHTSGCFVGAVVRQSALILPALLYFFSNVLVLNALSHLRFSMFSVVMNLRTFIVALLSIPLLHKHLNGGQWRSIIILVCAATVLCLEDIKMDRNLLFRQESMGIVLAMATSLTSAVAGMMAEKYLNADGGATGNGSSPDTVVSRADNDIDSSTESTPHQKDQASLRWEQQSVLSFYGLIFAVAFVLVYDAETLQAEQFFRGWNGTTVLLTILSAAEGLLVAIIIQQCGVLTRLVLGSVALCLCVLLEGMLFKEPVLFQELLAIVLVVTGVHLYFTAEGFPASSLAHPSSFEGKSDDAQYRSGSKGEDQGQGLAHKDKHEARPHPSSRFPFLLAVSFFKNADNSISIRRLSALVILGLLYVSATNNASVTLATKGLMEGSKAEGKMFAAKAMTQEGDVDQMVVDEVGAAGLLIESAKKIEVEGEDKAVLLTSPEALSSVQLSNEAGAEEGQGAVSAVSTASIGGMSEELRQSYFNSFLDELTSSDDGLLKAAAVTLARKTKSGTCNLEKDRVPDPWNPNDGVRLDIGLCIEIKSDAGILDEHIAFHWAQGVRKFIIYDDGSDDNPWSVLEKYVALGIVEYHDLAGHRQASSDALQLKVLNECFTTFRERGPEEGIRWVMFTDLDEFVLSSVPGETLSDTLNAKYKGEACLQVARTWYGSSFRHQKPVGLVTETYLLASPDNADGMPKLIANIHPENRTSNATALYSVHDFVNQTVIPCVLKKDVKDVRINHYLRSLEEYDKKALTVNNQNEKYKDPLKKFFKRDWNTHLSLTASAYACQVHALLIQVQEMQSAGKIPAVVRPKAWNETHTR